MHGRGGPRRVGTWPRPADQTGRWRHRSGWRRGRGCWRPASRTAVAAHSRRRAAPSRGRPRARAAPGAPDGSGGRGLHRCRGREHAADARSSRAWRRAWRLAAFAAARSASSGPFPSGAATARRGVCVGRPTDREPAGDALRGGPGGGVPRRAVRALLARERRSGAPGRPASPVRPRWPADRSRWLGQAKRPSSRQQPACRTGATRGGPGIRRSGAGGSARRWQDHWSCPKRSRSAARRSSARPGAAVRRPATRGQGGADSRASARNRGGCGRRDSDGRRRGRQRTGCSGAPTRAGRWEDRTGPRPVPRPVAAVAPLMPPAS